MVEPREIVVIQRGMRFSVNVNGPTRGYAMEVSGDHFTLPQFGGDGLVSHGHFVSPTAWFEDCYVPNYRVIHKLKGHLFEAIQHHSPFDVVAWRGNYVPYKYNLNNFQSIDSVSYDRVDPSMFTVLTCPSRKPGVSMADFLLLPPRWTVTEHTYRSTPFTRNSVTEFTGLIYGRGADGLEPGGATLRSVMTPTGDDPDTFEINSTRLLKPERVGEGNLASDGLTQIVFRSSISMVVSDWANKSPFLNHNYYKRWRGFKKRFDPKW